MVMDNSQHYNSQLMDNSQLVVEQILGLLLFSCREGEAHPLPRNKVIATPIGLPTPVSPTHSAR